MSLENYRDIWQRQGEDAIASADGDELLGRVKRVSARLDRQLLRRDLLETVCGVLVIVTFGFLLADAGGWLERVGSALTMAGAALMCWRMLAARRAGRGVTFGESVARRLQAELQRTRAQIRLLRNDLPWALGSLGGGVVLVFAGNSESMLATLAYTVVVLLLFAWILRGHRCQLRHLYEPHRKHLVELLERMDAGRSEPREG